MPGRLTPLVNGEYYHLYNRGSDKRDIFLQPRDYARFQKTFYYYHFSGHKPRFSTFTKFNVNSLKPISEEKLVEIICYCLMPNHFHFLVKQLTDGGISKFISQLINSYTKYFNTKYKRNGALLQGTFKAVRVESDEQLVHLSRYIHLNPVVSGLVRNLDKYTWSSYPEYELSENMCSTKEILGYFSSRKEYRKFHEDQVTYGKSLELLKHHNFDEL